jgi:hypothetical protein
MSLSKQGISIDCDHCKLSKTHNNNDFEVLVPVIDEYENRSGLAALECIITPNKHQINLVQLTDPDGKEIRVSPKTRERLQVTLNVIGKKKVCGNKKICPKEVINIVAHTDSED